MAAVSIVRYSGPIAINNAFNAIYMHGYDVTPENVVNDTTNYVTALAYVPGILLGIAITAIIVLWIVQCTYCSCCDICCRHNIRTSYNCPDSCVQPVRRDPRCRSCNAVWMIVLLSLGAAVLIAAMIVWLVLGTTMGTACNDSDQLDTYRQEVTAATNALTTAAIYAEELLVTTVLPVAQALYPNASAVPPPPAWFEALNTTAPLAAQQTSVDVLNAQQVSQITFDIGSITDDVRTYRTSTVIVEVVLIALLILMGIVGLLASFVPAEVPVRGCVDATQAFAGIIALVLSISVLGMWFATNMALGQGCQDPNSYLTEANSQQNTQSASSSTVNYYINCPDNTPSPAHDNLNAAYAQTLEVQNILRQTINSTTSIPLTGAASLTLTEYQILGTDIQTLQTQLMCAVPHNQLTQVEVDLCHSVQPQFVAALLLTIFGMFFLLAGVWTLPKIAETAPVPLASTPPPDTAKPPTRAPTSFSVDDTDSILDEVASAPPPPF